MTQHFNKLTPKQSELLTLLTEECAEVIQAITKIQRHGLESSYDNGETNFAALQRELGDVAAALKLCRDSALVDQETVDWYRDHKLVHVSKYLHHREDAK